VIWDTLRLVGWQGSCDGLGRLFETTTATVPLSAAQPG
jgi:hypothetical protein